MPELSSAKSEVVLSLIFFLVLTGCTWTVNDFAQATSLPGVRVVHTLRLPTQKGQGITLRDAWSKDLEINMTEDQWTEAQDCPFLFSLNWTRSAATYNSALFTSKQRLARMFSGKDASCERCGCAPHFHIHSGIAPTSLCTG